MKKKTFKLRKREEHATELEEVGVWVVKWTAMSLRILNKDDEGTKLCPETSVKYKAFTSKGQAELFEQELVAAFTLTGCQCYCAKTYKQD